VRWETLGSKVDGRTQETNVDGQHAGAVQRGIEEAEIFPNSARLAR